MIASPLFSVKGIPNIFKIGLSLIVAYLLYRIIPYNISLIDHPFITYGILVGKEVLFGLALGYVVNLIFISLQMAGQMIDFQIGFSMASYYDPLTSNRVSLLGNIYYWVGMALFLAVNGHHYLVYALVQSFELVPLASLSLEGLNLEAIIDLFSGSFLIAFQIAAPILVVLLLVDVMMGLLSRTVPQINILMLGLPMKVLVGLLTIIVLLPVLGSMMIRVIESMPYQVEDFLQVIPFIFLFAAEEKTEEATPKKKADARKKGQVPKSTDLNSAIILLLVVILIMVLGGFIFSSIQEFLQYSLGKGLNRTITLGNILGIFIEELSFYLKIAFPIMGAVMLVGVLVNIAQVGFIRTLHPLKPDFKKLNPIEGFKRIFSQKSLFDLGKNFLKLIIVAIIAYLFIRDNLQSVLATAQMSIQGVFPLFKGIVQSLMIRVGIVLFVLAIIDYFYQRYDFKKNLRMTKQEIKDEMKQSEGDPQIKSKMKQKQRQISMNRMMADVSNSTVVVTNPTHLAIAIQYDESSTGAPVILAKGADYVAEKIRKIAREEEIPIIENKPLARSLYKNVEIGEEIPMELYQAVAEILAIVYQMERKSKFI